MAKHMARYHPNQPTTTKFTSTIVARHHGCLPRFVDEALRIEAGEQTTSLANSKSEWGAGSLVRLQPTKTANKNTSQNSSKDKHKQSQDNPVHHILRFRPWTILDLP